MTSWAMGCVWVDGRVSAPGEARVSPLDHGFLYGDGLFETLRVYGGRPFRLEAHLSRLCDGLAALAFEAAPSLELLRRAVDETLERGGLDEALLRITVTRGVSGAGFDPRGCRAPTLVVALLPLPQLPASLYQHGVRACVIGVRHGDEQPSPGLKSTSYQRAVLGRLEVARRGADEGLFVDGAGRVLEALTANLFALGRDGLLRTPPVDCCLPGITRAELIDVARGLGLETRETHLTVDTVASAAEVLLTSSLREVVPVVALDERPIGAGSPGPFARELLARYRARTRLPAGVLEPLPPIDGVLPEGPDQGG